MNRKNLTAILLCMALSPSVMAEFKFSHLQVAMERKQTTQYQMPDDKTAKAALYEDLKKFSISKSIERGVKVPLKAKISLYEEFVEVSKTQQLPTGGEFVFGRQYYRSNYARGFQLKKHEFDTYGQEVLKQVIRDKYPEQHEVLNRLLDIRDTEHSNYLCEPDFKSGFQCYYRFKVVATVMKNSGKLESDFAKSLPDEFQLNVDASDNYSQNGITLTGIDTRFYNFTFSSIHKELEQTPNSGKNMKFDYLNEDIVFGEDEKRDFKSFEVFSGIGFDFVIDRFEYRSDNHSAELRTELAKRIKSGKFMDKFNSSVREEYQNENVKCQKGRSTDFDFACVEQDIISLKMSLKPQPGS